MNVRAQTVAAARMRMQSGSSFLYGWLLFALFVEYARPASFLPLLDFPFFYSAVPLALLAATMFSSSLRPVQEIFSDRIVKWVFILLGLVAIGMVFAPVTLYAWDVTIKVLGRVFLFIMLCRLLTTESRVRGVITTLLVAHLFLLAMNMEVLLNPHQRNYIEGGSFLGDGNDFALSLCILLPCTIELLLASKRKFAKLLFGASVLIIVFSIIATQSRGGTLGMLAVFGYLWWRSPNKGRTLAAIALVAVAALAFAPAEYFSRMSTLQSTAEDGSAQGRIKAWKGAIGMGAKNPLGIGAGHFGARWGLTAHSTYMLAFAELGPLGLVSVCMLVFGNMRQNAKLRGKLLERFKVRPDETLRESTRMLDMLNAATVGFAVAGAFLSATYYPHMFVLTGMLVSTRILAAQRARFATETEVRT